jgi:hypothetical protein
MVALTLQMPEHAPDFGCSLTDDAFEAFLGELRIVSPALADKLQRHVTSSSKVFVELDARETGFIASAANTVLQSRLVEDDCLELLAELT